MLNKTFSNKQVLVTGGAGFIGSHLTASLVARGANVRVLDNMSSGSHENLRGLSVSLIEGDIADPNVVQLAVAGCELVFHQAALVSVPLSLEDPVLNYKTNVTGAFNLFEAARQANVRRIVYASSAAVYGNVPDLPKREDSPLASLTPYAAAKQMNEVMAGTYTAAYDMEIVGLRYMNVFGPRQDPSSPYSGVLSIFCQAALNNDTCVIYGDGNQTRDFIFVDDVVQANLLAAQVSGYHLPRPAIFNIGGGKQTSLNEILIMLSKLLDRPISTRYLSERQGDIRYSMADISLAERVLGFRPQEEVFTGLQKTLDWFYSQKTPRRCAAPANE